MDLKATELGVSMMDAVGSLDTATDVLSALHDALSNKATGTLIKRAGSMWRFAQWIVLSIPCQFYLNFSMKTSKKARYPNAKN